MPKANQFSVLVKKEKRPYSVSASAVASAPSEAEGASVEPWTFHKHDVLPHEICDAQGLTVVEMRIGMGREAQLRALANGRLIAAAPELLACLKFAVTLAPLLIQNTAQIEHWRKVIAKATSTAPTP